MAPDASVGQAFSQKRVVFHPLDELVRPCAPGICHRGLSSVIEGIEYLMPHKIIAQLGKRNIQIGGAMRHVLFSDHLFTKQKFGMVMSDED